VARRLRLIGLAVLLGVSAAACRARPRPAPVISLEGDLAVSAVQVVTLSADGRELGRFKPEGHIQIDVPGREAGEYSSAMIPEFTARALYACGWRDIPLPMTVAPMTGHALQQAAEQGQKIAVHVSASSFVEKFAIIWVDKPADATVRVKVGQDERAVGPGREPSELFAFEDCADGRKVWLDGKPIGELPPDTRRFFRSVIGGPEDQEPRGDEFLIDVDGTHCYKAGFLTYASKKADFLFAPKFSTVLRPGVFHRLEKMQRPDYFLEEPPRTITGDTASMVFRDYVYRTAC